MNSLGSLKIEQCHIGSRNFLASSMLTSCFRRAPKLTAVKTVASQAQAYRQNSKIQQLYQTAQRTFENGKQPNCPEDLQALKQALREVPLQELGMQALSESTQTSKKGLFDTFQRKSRPPPITYVHIFEDQTVSIGMFCLPRNATIPLHNHPGMVVLSRVLYGKLHVLSYDWADARHPSSAGFDRKTSAAKRVLDKVVEPSCEPAVIFPTAGGNIHQFTAVTDCAVLDVLAPPYSPGGGRDCTYYTATEDEQHGNVHLIESKPPPSINMHNRAYDGVRI